MRLKVRITHKGESVTLIMEEGEQARVDDRGELALLVGGYLIPEAHADYNPRLGGGYAGYDPADPIQVLDALDRIERLHGAEIDIIELDVPALDEPPPDYLGVDVRDENARPQPPASDEEAFSVDAAYLEGRDAMTGELLEEDEEELDKGLTFSDLNEFLD